MNDEKVTEQITDLAEINTVTEGDNAFAIVNQKGKPKTLVGSIFALVVGVLSFLLSPIGWVGLMLGAGAIVLSVVARARMGFFNGLIIAALMFSIFGVIFSVASVIIVQIDPYFFSRLFERLMN